MRDWLLVLAGVPMLSQTSTESSLTSLGKQIPNPRQFDTTLSAAKVEEIRKRVDAGEQKKALAVEYGISRQTLYSALGNT